jgi:hypothetical protein
MIPLEGDKLKVTSGSAVGCHRVRLDVRVAWSLLVLLRRAPLGGQSVQGNSTHWCNIMGQLSILSFIRSRSRKGDSY